MSKKTNVNTAGKINSGLWPDGSRDPKKIAAGIRGNVQGLIDGAEIPIDSIMVALLGRDGDYRTCYADIEHLVSVYKGLEVVDIVPLDASMSMSCPYVVLNLSKHRRLWDGLVKFAEVVYPEPIDEDDPADINQEVTGNDCPFH